MVERSEGLVIEGGMISPSGGKSKSDDDYCKVITSSLNSTSVVSSTKGSEVTSCGGGKHNQVGTVLLFGIPIVSLMMDGKERLCLAQISSTLLKEYSYNEIHNRRVALGITCVQCTPVQLEILRRAGAMPVTSRRCGMITRREAERLCQSFLGDHAPPQLPENFAFEVYHECAWGCRGAFIPSRYNSSRAKCIRCSFCQLFFSPNKFVFHSHRLPDSRYVQPDAANFNSWRRHIKLFGDPPEDVSDSSNSSTTKAKIDSYSMPPRQQSCSSISAPVAAAQIVHAWEDVKAMFNGGTRKRLLAVRTSPTSRRNEPKQVSSSTVSSSGNGSRSKSERCEGSENSQNSHQNSPNLQIMSSKLDCSGNSSSSGAIWNPAVNRQNYTGSPNAIPSIGFHPALSLPWLRRPIFPFGSSLGTGCKFINPYFNQNSEIYQSNSAFKPVNLAKSSSGGSFFNWLTNNIGHPIFPTHASVLPEDLSIPSGSLPEGRNGHNHSQIPNARSNVSVHGNVKCHSEAGPDPNKVFDCAPKDANFGVDDDESVDIETTNDIDEDSLDSSSYKARFDVHREEGEVIQKRHVKRRSFPGEEIINESKKANLSWEYDSEFNDGSKGLFVK